MSNQTPLQKSIAEIEANRNEKIKEIAVFDGWLIIPEGTYRECHNQTIWFGHGGKFDCYHDITAASDMPYLTDLNALHRVALDVMDAMTELFNTTIDGDVFMPASDLEYNIKRACYIRPINGQYTYLVDAVYEAIVYLKKHNQCQPK